MRQPELGKKISELRKVKGMTQEELAFQCEMNVRSIQRIESGEVNPRAFTLGLLSKVFDYEFSTVEKRELLLWRVILHLSCFIPIVVVPILMLVMKKDEFPEIERECKDVLNFQLSMCIYLFTSSVLIFLIIGILFLILLGLSCGVITIINTIRVTLGLDYHYPGTIKILK